MALFSDISEDVIDAIKIENGPKLLGQFRILFTPPRIMIGTIIGPNSKKGDKYLLYCDENWLYFLQKRKKGFCINLKDVDIRKGTYGIFRKITYADSYKQLSNYPTIIISNNNESVYIFNSINAHELLMMWYEITNRIPREKIGHTTKNWPKSDEISALIIIFRFFIATVLAMSAVDYVPIIGIPFGILIMLFLGLRIDILLKLIFGKRKPVKSDTWIDKYWY